MSLCASCGITLPGEGECCPHHTQSFADDWAKANRIMCDFFHRGVTPMRLVETERVDQEFWVA